ncbi:MerR family DNA-binding transcriptional regulator [Allgaiera indica]|uniref:MerR family DNA-binding transcriptional regulator n=1 Tax=Allgaiera indica TaxID=765699 RepID=UPI00115FD8EC|nr:MerR family DNA-binding transcriptional regulator [Allgaiera indica]
MRIAEASERTGFSISTIRYYERSGLCPIIKRGADGKRRRRCARPEWRFPMFAPLLPSTPRATRRVQSERWRW